MRKKNKKEDVDRVNVVISKIVFDFLNDPSFPEAGITYSRLLAKGYSEPKVIQLVGSILLAHVYLAGKTGIPVDFVKLKFDLSKLPHSELFGNSKALDLSAFIQDELNS